MVKLRIISLLFIFTIVISAAYAQDSGIPEGFSVVGSSGVYKLVLTPYATYPLMYEEVIPRVSTQTVTYEERIILEGKSGSGPGEFGIAVDSTYEGEGGPDSEIVPGPAVENSRGEIYVLDAVNNRIQKFTKDGQYISSIPVPSRADKNGKSVVKSYYPSYAKGQVVFEDTEKPYYVGIGIAMDAQDTLYYYFGKDVIAGEVWLFRKDRLKKKITGTDIPAKASRIFIMDNKPFIISGDVFDLYEQKTILLKDAWRNRKEGDLRIIIPEGSRHDIYFIKGSIFQRCIIPVRNDFEIDPSYYAFGVFSKDEIFLIVSCLQESGSTEEYYLLKTDCSRITKSEGRVVSDNKPHFEFGTFRLRDFRHKFK